VSETISLAVWDVPMPVVAGGTFSIKAGAKAAAGKTIEVDDSSGKVVASRPLGSEPLPNTEGLFWTALELAAPANEGLAEYTVRVAGCPTSSPFSVVAAGKPEHTLTVTVTERDSKAALEGVEIRLGAFHARTDKAGRAELHVCTGEYQLALWRTAHMAQPKPLTINADMTVELTMVHVPEDHPDARWVR
jgi:hypothetical protein